VPHERGARETGRRPGFVGPRRMRT